MTRTSWLPEWNYLQNRITAHYGRLVTSSDSVGRTLGEIQMEACMSANRDLINRFKMTATELMEFMMEESD